MRFAMEEMKIALCSVISKVKFVPTKETPVMPTSAGYFFPANASLLHSYMFQDQLTFEDGFLFVVKALDIKVGIELR